MNADQHPLMNRMHKHDPKSPWDAQDKRMVVVLEQNIWEDWLTVNPVNASKLMTAASPTIFKAEPDLLR